MLAVAVVVAACAAPASTPTPAPSRQVSDEVVSVLAGAGIAVVPSFDDLRPLMPVTEPRSPLTFTVWQAANLSGHGALFGSQLDELGVAAGIPADSLPFSYVVAAWASRFETPGAVSARQILGERDWLHPGGIVFPHLVLALFVADMTRDAADPGVPVARTQDRTDADPLTGLTAAAAPGVVGAPVAAADDACSAVAGFVDQQFAALLEALTGGSDSALATAAKLALEAAKTVIGGLLSVVLAPILVPLRVAVTIVGVLASITSLLVDWDVEVTHSLDPNHFAHAGEPDHVGTFTATVVPGLSGWPDAIAGCVTALTGAPLPDLAPPGKPVAWITTSDAPTAVAIASVVAGETDDEIQPDSTATLTYVTGREGMLLTGSEFLGRFEVIVQVQRFTGTELDPLLDQLVFSGEAGKVLKDLLGGTIDDAKQHLTGLMLQDGDDVKEIGYHNPHCLVGTWRLDPASYLAALGPVATALKGTAAVVAGHVDITFADDGGFAVTLDGFTPEVYYTTTSGSGGNVRVALRVRMHGSGTGTFTLDDDDAGEVVVDGATGTVTVTALTNAVRTDASVRINDRYVPGDLPVGWPGVLGSGTSSYLCDPKLLVVEPEGAGRSFTYQRLTAATTP